MCCEKIPSSNLICHTIKAQLTTNKPAKLSGERGGMVPYDRRRHGRDEGGRRKCAIVFFLVGIPVGPLLRWGDLTRCNQLATSTARSKLKARDAGKRKTRQSQNTPAPFAPDDGAKHLSPRTVEYIAWKNGGQYWREHHDINSIYPGWLKRTIIALHGKTSID